MAVLTSIFLTWYFLFKFHVCSKKLKYYLDYFSNMSQFIRNGHDDMSRLRMVTVSLKVYWLFPFDGFIHYFMSLSNFSTDLNSFMTHHIYVDRDRVNSL